MDLGLTGRTALVTGASKGIGLATARTLASEGCNVWMVARTSDVLADAADGIRQEFGVRATPIAADMSRSDDVDRVWGEVGVVGVPDIVVNNAGSTPRGSIADVDEATWRAAWDLKVFGYVNVCRLAVRDMTARGSGVIVNIIAGAGARPSPGYLAGGTGNAALMAMTTALGSTSLRHGVRVVGINPGLIKTERLETLLRTTARLELGDENRWEELLDAEFPPGDVSHIASAVAFLASDRSGNTTGTVLAIDGGSTAR